MNQREIWVGVFFWGMISGSVVFAQSYREEGVRIGLREFKDIPGVSVGSARLKAAVSTEGRYDSNILLASDDKQADYIGIISPKFLLDMPLGIDGRHLVQLMYTADAAAFSNYKSQNYVNQNAAANVNLRLPWGYFNVMNDFKDTVDRSSTEFTDPVRRRENRSRVATGVEINRLAYELGYSHYLKNYYEHIYDTINYAEDVYSGTVSYQLFPKTKALLEYSHGVIDYSKDVTHDGEYNQFMAGIKGSITGKTSGIIKGGYQKRDYDVAGRNGYKGFISEVGVIAKFSERTELTFKYVSTARESTYGTNNYYNANTFSADLEQKLIGNFSVLMSSSISRNLYPEVDTAVDQKRRDSILAEGLILRYNMKDRVRINIGYEYKENISNIDTRDYNDSIVSLRFDFLL